MSDWSYAPNTVLETLSTLSPKKREDSWGIWTSAKWTAVMAIANLRKLLLFWLIVSLRRAKNSYSSIRSVPITMLGFRITSRLSLTSSNPPTTRNSWSISDRIPLVEKLKSLLPRKYSLYALIALSFRVGFSFLSRCDYGTWSSGNSPSSKKIGFARFSNTISIGKSYFGSFRVIVNYWSWVSLVWIKVRWELW